MPASAAAPSGDLFEPRPRVAEASAVARDHLDIGEKVVAEGHGLRGLQMGEARHHGRGFAQGLFGERALQIEQRSFQAVDEVADVKPEIGRDLIVSRARRMQAAGDGTDDFGEPRFDVHVNVFERPRENEGSGTDFLLDLREAFRDALRVRARDDALRGQHRDMGLRSLDILGPEPLVEVDGDVDRVQYGVRRVGETSAPDFAGHVALSAAPSREPKTMNEASACGFRKSPFRPRLRGPGDRRRRGVPIREGRGEPQETRSAGLRRLKAAHRATGAARQGRGGRAQSRDRSRAFPGVELQRAGRRSARYHGLQGQDAAA